MNKLEQIGVEQIGHPQDKLEDKLDTHRN